MLFWINSTLILKKNLMVNLFSEPIYKFLKTNIKSYGDKATDFHYKEMPKAGSNPTCLAGISLDSALKKEGNCYLQVFLKK